MSRTLDVQFIGGKTVCSTDEPGFVLEAVEALLEFETLVVLDPPTGRSATILSSEIHPRKPALRQLNAALREAGIKTRRWPRGAW
jgi:hypothetical protein